MKKSFIYADHAATTQLDNDALEAMGPYLATEFGNPSSLYSVARKAHKAIEDSRKIIAESIGAKPYEVYFTSGGTESDNWAIKGTAFSMREKGKHIITSAIEHHAILNSCAFLEKLGYEITQLPVDKEGIVSIQALRNALRNDTILVSAMLANNEIGTIQNISEFSTIAHSNQTVFHTDAVQAIGHIPVNVEELGVDMLSASAHKFNGPKGVGFFYLRDGISIEGFSSGGGQERHMRGGTENVAGIVGMATALKKNICELECNDKYLKNLENYFWDQMNRTSLNFIANGSHNHLPGNINISFRATDGEMILHRLDLMGIAVSTGSACNSSEIETSHVLKAICVPDEYVTGTIRITLGKENTKKDIDTIVKSINRILS